MLNISNFETHEKYIEALRDYAAIHADGLDDEVTTNYAKHFNRDPCPDSGDYLAWAKWFAKADANLRYIRADAMIAARGQGQ